VTVDRVEHFLPAVRTRQSGNRPVPVGRSIFTRAHRAKSVPTSSNMPAARLFSSDQPELPWLLKSEDQHPTANNQFPTPK